MKYLITGANGFLGGRLSDFLENKGFEVFRGTRKIEIIQSVPNSSNWVLTDFDDIKSLQYLCKNIDFIIHAAGPNAEKSMLDFSSSLNSFSKATQNLVSVVKESNIKRFIYLSTMHVYKKNLNGMIEETTPALNDHPYALINILGEKIVSNTLGKDPNKSIILRLSNIFGYPISKEVDCWNLFINNICRELIQKKSITIKSNPLIKRDFLPVNSFCEMILNLSSFRFSNENNNIINLGSGNAINLFEAAEKINNIFYEKYNLKIDIKMLKNPNQVSDFKFCNNFLKRNNLNLTFLNNDKIELINLLDKCYEYFNK